jgi:hypothetical protein
MCGSIESISIRRTNKALNILIAYTINGGTLAI